MRFIATLVLLFLSLTANAQTGMFYNPERSGEGIIVTIKDGALAFAFFTYFDQNAVNEVPPAVSPPRPDVEIVLPQCEIEITTVPPVSIPPTVSPPRPPSTDTPDDTNLYGGIQAWYIGAGAYVDGKALGNMYYHKPTSYPYSFDGVLSNEYKVATFLMEGNGEGFDMYLDCTRFVPTGLYMCNNVMTFNRLIIGE